MPPSCAIICGLVVMRSGKRCAFAPPGALSQSASVHILQLVSAMCPSSHDLEAAAVSHSNAANVPVCSREAWPCYGAGLLQWQCYSSMVQSLWGLPGRWNASWCRVCSSADAETLHANSVMFMQYAVLHLAREHGAHVEKCAEGCEDDKRS